jgi:CRP-like cAMP-binding protein
MMRVVYAAVPDVRKLDAPVRVRQVLIDLATGFGPTLELTQADIAVAANCARETASRELARLERAGVLATGRAKVTVLDLDAIRHLNGSDGPEAAADSSPVNSPAKTSYDQRN